MKQKKIFIGVELPSNIKKRLVQRIEKWRDLPIKWSREDNFHIALMTLGFVSEEKLPEICQQVRIAAENFEAFDLPLEKIVFGPSAEKARMVWLAGEANEKLRGLSEALEKELGIFQSEKKSFSAHVTLGRIRQEKWVNLPETPTINEKLSVHIPVDSLTIFESTVDQGKRKFIAIETCPLR